MASPAVAYGFKAFPHLLMSFLLTFSLQTGVVLISELSGPYAMDGQILKKKIIFTIGIYRKQYLSSFISFQYLLPAIRPLIISFPDGDELIGGTPDGVGLALANDTGWILIGKCSIAFSLINDYRFVLIFGQPHPDYFLVLDKALIMRSS